MQPASCTWLKCTVHSVYHGPVVVQYPMPFVRLRTVHLDLSWQLRSGSELDLGRCSGALCICQISHSRSTMHGQPPRNMSVARSSLLSPSPSRLQPPKAPLSSLQLLVSGAVDTAIAAELAAGTAAGAGAAALVLLQAPKVRCA